jgi:hypothetical protein
MKNLEQLVKRLGTLDPDKHRLYFNIDFELNLRNYWFDFEENRFVIDDIQYEDNEIPLLGAFRLDAAEHIGMDNSSWELDFEEESNSCLTDDIGYYTKDERPYDIQSDFENHSQWNFSPGGRYAWNIPGIPNHTLIGFYWLPLTSLLTDLQKPVILATSI